MTDNIKYHLRMGSPEACTQKDLSASNLFGK